MTVRAELHNDTDTAVEGVVRAEFDAVTCEKKVTLSPRETLPVILTPNEFPQLKIDHPELWWPAGLGDQKLHRITVSFTTSGSVSDTQSANFGIREITESSTALRPGLASYSTTTDWEGSRLTSGRC